MLGLLIAGQCNPLWPLKGQFFYRERAAGMYSALPYAIAQVVVEIPYVFVQAAYYSNYTVIVYAMVSFKLTAAKFLWFFYISFFSFLYWTCYGMMTVSITQNQEIASAFYALFNLFSGFFIPRPRIPKWWAWYCWICPVAWTVYGLIISQYGDQTKMIQIMGTSTNQTIADYVQENFGFDPDIMIPVAVVLAAFTVFFAFIFAFCIKILNFKTR